MKFKRFYLFKQIPKKMEGYGYFYCPEVYMRTSNAAQAFNYAKKHFEEFDVFKSIAVPNCLILIEKVYNKELFFNKEEVS
jgi:hypothetical protein